MKISSLSLLLKCVTLLIFLSSFTQCKNAKEASSSKLAKNHVVQIVDNHAVLENEDKVFLDGLQDPDQTIFFLLRHAEKLKTPGESNPDLTREGYRRAAKLKSILKGVKLDMVCSTSTMRTLETVRPCAVDQDIPFTTYTPSAQSAFLQNTIREKAGTRVLVVGHSNTIPNALDVLTGTQNQITLTDDDYDNLYVVAVKSDGTTKLFSLKF